MCHDAFFSHAKINLLLFKLSEAELGTKENDKRDVQLSLDMREE